MSRRIFRAGNSLVVSLPADAMDLLGLIKGSEVLVHVDRDEKRIEIYPTKVELESIDAEFGRQVNDFIEAYRPALEALSRAE